MAALKRRAQAFTIAAGLGVSMAGTGDVISITAGNLAGDLLGSCNTRVGKLVGLMSELLEVC